MFKIFMLLYADDIVIFANNQEQLQNSLDLLLEYCNRWKLTINITKSNGISKRGDAATEPDFLL